MEPENKQRAVIKLVFILLYMIEQFFNANINESKNVLLIISRSLRCPQVKKETIMIESLKKNKQKKKQWAF